MSFWSSERIRVVQATKHLVETKHYNADRVKCGKYELTLSREVIVTPDGAANLPECGKGPSLPIPAGQYAILYAEEEISVPNDAIAFIAIKFGFTYKGLVNISGFHVDPGFKGRLKFSVYNAGNHTIYMDYGSECFQIWFADLLPETVIKEDLYDGTHRNQNRVTPDDRYQMSEGRHSTDALHKQIRKLESRVATVYAVGIVVIVPLVIGLGVAVFDHWIGEKTNLASNGELVEIGTVIIMVALVAGFIGTLLYWLTKNYDVRGKISRWLDDQKKD